MSAKGFGGGFAAICLGFVATPVFAQDSGSAAAAAKPERLLSADINWSRRPDGSDVARLYPAKALAANVNGRMAMECTVSMSKLTDCQVAADPTDYGFEEAALAFSKIFVSRLKTKKGVEVEERRVLIPITMYIPR